jgi:hypothetical protein
MRPCATDLPVRARALLVLLVVALVGPTSLTSTSASASASASAVSSSGTEFAIAFLANLPATLPIHAPGLSLFVAGPTATSGTVEGGPLTEPIAFTVEPGSVTTISIPIEALATHTTGVQSGRGLVLRTGAPVSVYGLNKRNGSTDGFVALPTDALGTRYRVTSLTGGQFGVLATRDATTVTLGNGTEVMLQAGELYMVAGQDDTGMLVTASAPVALFVGHECSNEPGGTCDHLVAQVPPTSTWGTDFVTIRFANENSGTDASAGELFRIVADEDDTVVRLDGTVIAELDAGEFHVGRYLARSSSSSSMIVGGRITATRPVLISHFMRRGAYRVDASTTTTGDPSMYLLPPTAQFRDSYTVATMASGFAFNAVNVVIPTAAIDAFRLNGSAWPAEDFTPIGDTGYSGAQLRVTPGTYTLTADEGFSIVLYGANPADSYATVGGLSLAPVALLGTLAPGAVVTVEADDGGPTACVTATVTDADGLPLSGLSVGFTLSGALTGTGSAISGPDGVATFCVPLPDGTVGDVTIAVVSGVLSASAVGTIEPDDDEEGDDPADDGEGDDESDDASGDSTPTDAPGTATVEVRPTGVPTGGGPRPAHVVLLNGLLVMLLIAVMGLGLGGPLVGSYRGAAALAGHRTALRHTVAAEPVAGPSATPDGVPRVLDGFDLLEQRLEAFRRTMRVATD